MNLTLLNIVASTVVRRVSLPRKLAGKVTRNGSLNARMWQDLSEHDKSDIRQDVALALVAAGLPDKAVFRRLEKKEAAANLAALEFSLANGSGNRERQRAAEAEFERHHARSGEVPGELIAAARDALKSVPLSVWRSAFIAARITLRMGNRRSDAEKSVNPLPVTGDVARLDLNDFPLPDVDPEREAVRRCRIVRRVRYLRSCIDASFAADLSRKRVAGRTSARKFLRWLTAFSSGIGYGTLEFSRTGNTRKDQALNDAKRRFAAYIARGEDALTAASLEGVKPISRFSTFAALPVGIFPDVPETETETQTQGEFFSFRSVPEVPPVVVPVAVPVETVCLPYTRAEVRASAPSLPVHCTSARRRALPFALVEAVSVA